MAVFHRSSCGALALALAFACTAVEPASARQNSRKTQQRPTPFAIELPAATPARYFTINQVLAKREGQRGSPLQFATTTTTTMTDVPSDSGDLLPTGEPFGLSTFRAPEGLLWVKWRAVQQQLKAEAGEITLCRTDDGACSPTTRRFLALVDNARAHQGRARLETVNREVNAAIRYTTDYAQYTVADRWTPPLATLATGRGDCEDYAIAKYAVLHAAGIPASDLRLLLVRDRAVRQDHAVLAVRDNGRWLVLDNRHLTLTESRMLPQFTPLFSLDHNGVSLFAAPYAVRGAPIPAPASPAPIALDVGEDMLGEPALDGDRIQRPASTSGSPSTAPYLL